MYVLIANAITLAPLPTSKLVSPLLSCLLLFRPYISVHMCEPRPVSYTHRLLLETILTSMKNILEVDRGVCLLLHGLQIGLAVHFPMAIFAIVEVSPFWGSLFGLFLGYSSFGLIGILFFLELLLELEESTSIIDLPSFFIEGSTVLSILIILGIVDVMLFIL